MEAIVGTLLAGALFFVAELLFGDIIGERIARSLEFVFGPPIGIFIVAALWVGVAVLTATVLSNPGEFRLEGAAWLTFFAAGVGSTLALVYYKDKDRA